MTIFGNNQFHALSNILLENPWKNAFRIYINHRLDNRLRARVQKRALRPNARGRGFNSQPEALELHFSQLVPVES